MFRWNQGKQLFRTHVDKLEVPRATGPLSLCFYSCSKPDPATRRNGLPGSGAFIRAGFYLCYLCRNEVEDKNGRSITGTTSFCGRKWLIWWSFRVILFDSYLYSGCICYCSVCRKELLIVHLETVKGRRKTCSCRKELFSVSCSLQKIKINGIKYFYSE